MSCLRIIGIVGGVLAYFVAHAVNAQCTDLQTAWAGTSGGQQDERGLSVKLDSKKSVFVSGYLNGSGELDLDPTNGEDIFDAPHDGLFVTKLSSSFDYLWSGVIGRSAHGYTAIDINDDVIISGSFSSIVDFDPSAGEDERIAIGEGDVYVSKWNGDGAYLWTHTFGGKGGDSVMDIDADSAGSIIVSGFFEEIADFDPTGLDIHHSNGGLDVFVTKFLVDGSYGWSHSFGGVAQDLAYGVASSPNDGSVCITGTFKVAADFDPEGARDVHVSEGGSDIFVTKLMSDGAYAWTRTIGSKRHEHAFDLSIDPLGNVIVAGYFDGEIDFDPGSTEDFHESIGSADIFVMKLAHDGAFLWAQSIGGEFWENPESVATDEFGDIYITGCFGAGAEPGYSVDFDPTKDADRHASNGGCDIFVTKLMADGSYAWTATMGNDLDERGMDVAIDSNGDVIVTGRFGANGPIGYNVDFDPGVGVEDHQSMGDGDMFVVKLEQPDVDGPQVLHAAGLAGETRPFSGYIDPRAESLTGEAPDLGVDEVTFVFDEPIRAVGGGEVGVDSFVVTTTGGTPPIIDSIDASQNPMINVTFSTPPPLKEWTTVTAIVEDECGNPIASSGNLGPGALEPDRIDFLFLPGDVDASRLVTPFDMLRFRQIANKVFAPTKGEIEDFVDTNRTGVYTAFDFLMFRQLLNGVAPATQAWTGKTPNHPQP